MGIVRIEDAEKFVESFFVTSGKDMAIKVLILSILDEAKKPNMRLKVKEYIAELEEENNRLENVIGLSNGVSAIDKAATLSRIQTIEEVKNDLKNRLEELI